MFEIEFEFGVRREVYVNLSEIDFYLAAMSIDINWNSEDSKTYFLQAARYIVYLEKFVCAVVIL